MYRAHDDKQSQDGDRPTREIEENIMDLYHSTNEYRRPSRQNHTLNAIVDFRYLAPAKLVWDEAHERMRADAALRQIVDGNEPTAGRPQLVNSVQHRLGGILILIGTRLQGVHALATTVPAASGPGSAMA
jgi:hypothetical protein